jgi:superfamily I DNA/RNA helicase
VVHYAQPVANLLSELDPEQQAVATAVTGPVIVLAGAGTGKTRAITHRIAHAISTGAHQADATLAVTFTVRAANEMKARLQQLGVGGVQVRTLHASAYQLVQHFWPEVIGGSAPAICDDPDSLISRALLKHGLTAERSLVRDFAAEISWTKAMRLGSAEYLTHAANRALTAQLEAAQIAEVMRSYDQLLTASHQCDLADIVLLAAAMMEDQPRIAASFTNRYQHFTVDEYQDISPAQQHLLNQWWADRDSVCVVGDPGQAIYGFAGANSSFLVDLQQRFSDATIAKLTRSYRSAPAIIHAANSFAEIPTVSQRDIAGSVEVNSSSDAKSEASFIANWVSQQVAAGISLTEIAVLSRLNAQLPLIDAALREVGIATNLANRQAGVDLLTIHSAKGLEWKAVAIAGVNDQLLPYQPFGTVLSENQLAEERRLFYVAMTRAADKLLLSYSRDRGASEFLATIDADSATDLVTTHSKVTKNAPKLQVAPKVSKCRFCNRGLVTAAEIASVRCASCAPWVDPSVLAKLNQWRANQAQTEGLVPFLIFTDTTLQAIAEVGDLAAAAQIGIAGITPLKLERYAKDFQLLFAK